MSRNAHQIRFKGGINGFQEIFIESYLIIDDPSRSLRIPWRVCMS